MNPPLPRHQALLETATQRIKTAARAAAQRCVDSLGLAALSALKIRERDDFLAAQFELNRKLADFAVAFDERLDQRVAAAAVGRPDSTRGDASSRWESLSLVADDEVEATISADRFALAIQHASEWELRELDAYMGSLLQTGRPEQDRNPLRPELVGKALVAAVEAVTDRPEVRKLLAAELGRSLASTMPRVYADVVGDLRASGVQPASLALRAAESHSARGSGPGGLARTDPGASRTAALGVPNGLPGHAAGFQPGGRSGHADGHAGSSRYGATSHGGGYTTSGGSAGGVDAQLMALIRRLAVLGSGSTDSSGQADFGLSRPSGMTVGGGHSLPMPANQIYDHRDELRQASTGTLDHMVIDVVGSLFEQILSDPKVPPQMARLIARLQLPVLRVALGDSTFFSSRRHPVRRFVNRVASLACAFDDFAEDPGKQFLVLVRELVQDIVAGDFDQMALYEQKLAALEAFIAEQAQREVSADGGNAAELLEGKEHELRVQQRYMRQLHANLAAVDLPEFLREFLTQAWSQVIVRAVMRGGAEGEGSDQARRMRQAGRELVMSVQPKGLPADRKAFLSQLPQLMKDMNDGLATIGWPESAKKLFFSQLLPAHAESLKGQSLSQLDYNLLAKQLDAILGAPLPQAGALLPSGEPVLPSAAVALDEVRFSEQEAQQIGLVNEATFDWDGSVDIEIGAEAELTEVDINIDGLPPVEAVEPSRGASLADHVQLGFAYQMHLEGQWQKVKLSYASPGRAFFVFTRGTKHQRTISMTLRMLQRLCDTGRLRAFENAFLLERATARARKQLAALKAGASSAH